MSLLSFFIDYFRFLMYFILVLISFTPFSFCEDTLVHVHAIWRHGERNPRKLFNGELNNASAFPDGIGQLTKNGINQLYILGQHFQTRYINQLEFLSPNYSHSEVFARSTALDRACVSAMAFFSGLYSNNTNANYILVPIPIHTVPSTDDFLYLLGLKCERKYQLLDFVQKSNEMKTHLNNFFDLLMEVADETETSIDFYSALDVFDAAVLEEMYGLPLPLWVSERLPDWKIFYINYVLILHGFVPFSNSSFPFDLQLELKKMSGGSLIAEIVVRLKLKIECKNFQTSNCVNVKDQKLYTYSGHDTTLISCFVGLGFNSFIFDTKDMPSVGSSVVLELWEEDDVNIVAISKGNQYDYYYVKIYYYQNSSVEEPKYIADLLPECQGRKGCPLQYLIGRAESLRPKPDLKSYCSQAINKATKYNFNSFVILFISCIFYCLNR